MAAPGHPQRPEDLLLDVALERCAGDRFDDQSGQGMAVVAVDEDIPRRVRPQRHLRSQVPAQGFDHQRIGVTRVSWVLEARRVSQQVGQRHGVGEDVLQFERREVLIDVGVQVEPPPLDELHHRGGHERPGSRAEPHHGRFRVYKRSRLQVSVAIPPGVDQLAPLDKHEGQTWDVQLLHPIGEEGVGEGLHVSGIDDTGTPGALSGRQADRSTQNSRMSMAIRRITQRPLANLGTRFLSLPQAMRRDLSRSCGPTPATRPR